MNRKRAARDIIESTPNVRSLEMAWWKGPSGEWRPAAEAPERGNNRVLPWNAFEVGDQSILHTHSDLKTRAISTTSELRDTSPPLVASLTDLHFFVRASDIGVKWFHIASVDKNGKVTGYATYSVGKNFVGALDHLTKHSQQGQSLSSYLRSIRIHDELVKEDHLRVKLTPIQGYRYNVIERRFVKKE